MNVNLLTGADLAFIGDAYYELYIRKYLINKDITKTKVLKEISLNYVSAHAHSVIYASLKNNLTEEENNIFLRGRNSAPFNHRKNLNRTEYQTSSGLEAVIGYLYLTENYSRLEEVMTLCIKYAEENI